VLLWAVGQAVDGRRLRRWSEVRDELATALAIGGASSRMKGAPEYPVAALRDSALWEIRSRSPAPAAHSSRPRQWLDREDPEFGLSAPLADLLQDTRSRDRFVATLHAIVDRTGDLDSTLDAGWDIETGTILRRRDIHEQYGGQRQSGISPSLSTPNVLLFTNPVRGRIHGYFDGWGDDGLFHYTGEGQVGDQRMIRGNLSILRHEEHGRALRLFRAVPGGVEYVGEFEVDPDRPWYTSEAPETGNGPLRTVIVFRIRSTGSVQKFEENLPITPIVASRVTSVLVEAANVEEFAAAITGGTILSRRREAGLVRAYYDHLRELGREVCRKQILPANESRPLFTDLYDETTAELVEAKGNTTREAIRMGIGQLLDYRRFIDPVPRLALLLPTEPRSDLLQLCASVNVTVIWQSDGQWKRHDTTSSRSKR